ncbi:MAG: sulfite exporter TauE/SafE family protein [Nitrospirae bacterium]|nr:MAG: sulfite exporter TauE/SafE family protein [Nitrospirota bacterium]
MGHDLLAAFTGVVVGLALSLIGGGGSVIGIPLLVYLVGLPVQPAMALSLVVVNYSALFGTWRALTQGYVRGLAALVVSLTGAVGAWTGARAHRLVSEDIVLGGFGLLLVGLSAWMVKRRPGGGERPGAPEETCAQRFSVGCAGKALMLGWGVGLITGFFGIGGGFLIVPLLRILLDFPPRVAVGTSLCIVALTSVGGIVGHWDQVDLHVPILWWTLGGSLAGMVIGGRLLALVHEDWLHRMFALLIGFLGVGMLSVQSLRLIP